MTKSKRKKKLQMVLDALRERAPLSLNKGKYDNTPKRKPTKKQRRHSGWKTPPIIFPTMKFSEMIENALEPNIYYDDWENYRDSFRDNRDNTHLYKKRGRFWRDEEEIKELNKKLKKQREIRKAMKKSKR